MASLFNQLQDHDEDWTVVDEADGFELDELDPRSERRPSDMVQSKLIAMMPRGMAMPVSGLHSDRLVSR